MRLQLTDVYIHVSRKTVKILIIVMLPLIVNLCMLSTGKYLSHSISMCMSLW